MKKEINEEYSIETEERDTEWTCELFGGTDIIMTPLKGKVPNWFWRWMQYLILGNKWKKNK